MAMFTVRWEIDLEANTPQEAAEIARDVQLDADTIAVCFSAVLKDESWRTAIHIDLLPEEV